MSASLLCAVCATAQPKLNADNIDEVIKAMSLEEKATLLVGGSQSIDLNGVPTGNTTIVPGAAGQTRGNARFGIPATVVADGPAGLRISPVREGTDKTFYCTGFPIGTLLASSWDLSLVEKVTEAMGNEVLEYGVDVILSPGLNLHRNPLCGRNFEYYSEDPVLSGNMAAAYVRGIQSNGVGTSIKHFAANNQETNRNEDDAQISTRALRELYLKNFEIAVRKGRPWTVMSSYNKINGKYTQQSFDLLTKVLRDDWGFDGIVMTDWGNKPGTVDAVKAGNDLMEPGNQIEIDRIVAAVKDGSLPVADVDRNVRRMLEYIIRTPKFKGYRYSNDPDLKEHATVARDAAAESIVMLRNENGTLPLKGDEKISLFGISSIDFVAGGTGSGNVNKAYVVNMAEALTNAGFTPDSRLVNYYESYCKEQAAADALTRINPRGVLGTYKLAEVPVSREAIELQAAANDAAVIVIGRNAGEGADRRIDNDFELSDVERHLISNVSTAFHMQGKKVVVVLNIGGVIETASWKNLADAILLPWSPGQEGANAVADILKGKVNPSGKLPMTFPTNFIDHPSSANFPLGTEAQSSFRFRGPRKNVDLTEYGEGIWVGYRYFDTKGPEVSYPFGFGLSYTSFEYSAPVVKVTKDGGITASITVRNTGSVAGKEVVEVYVTAPAGGLEKPAKELKAFGKTGLLQPGESQTLDFSVSAYELASFNEATNQWETAAGNYRLLFGASVSDIKSAASFKLGKRQIFTVSDAYRD